MIYNLLEENWIPVLYLNGDWERVGIRKALEDAGRIRQIAASNPMDNVALLRFLLAVWMWCKGNTPDKIPNGQFPPDLLTKLDDHKECFNLLGNGKRFYQDRNTPSNERPIGDLLVEFPTETKIAHFRHVRDKEYGLCPACCALGIIRFSTFANAYGQGGKYTAAVNGPTPAYVLRVGATLLASLRANWPTDATTARGQPGWLSEKAPNSDQLTPVTVFSWRSRTLWLGDRGAADEICVYCGQATPLIKELAFSGNWKPPFTTAGKEKKFWDRDPHLLLEQASAWNQGSDDDPPDHDEPTARADRKKPKQPSTLGFPAPGASSTAHTRFWRRALRAITDKPTDTQCHSPLHVVVAGPAANKGLYQDAASLSLRQPSAGAASYLTVLSKVGEGLLWALRSATPNPQRKHPERKAALDALSSWLEADLRDGWNNGDDNTDNSERFFQRVAESVVSSTTAGSPLRRREAVHKAQEAVRELVEKAMKTDAKADDAAPAATGKKKHSPRKSRKEAKP